MAIAEGQASTQVIEVCLPQLARGVLESAKEITSIHLKNHTCDKRMPVSVIVIICFGQPATKMSETDPAQLELVQS